MDAHTGGGGSGTVTSLGLTLPAEFTVTGSPITKSEGTFVVTKAKPDGEPGVCGSRFGSPRGAVVPTARGGGHAAGGRGPWRDGGDGPSDRPG